MYKLRDGGILSSKQVVYITFLPPTGSDGWGRENRKKQKKSELIDECEEIVFKNKTNLQIWIHHNCNIMHMICFSLILKLEKNPNIDLADMHGIPLKLKSYWELRVVGIGSQNSLTVWCLTH